ncbi:GGDEF domain-containing protein [Periweissella beninensis]|uniref:GGDEF domain-containing protein n=1 Tax=Periweissella beninensis TaxID=504936 RepID=UPI0021A787DE|nr:GGDEF domain-containing protein [Periweissella beninensis]MCT4396671.1 GGDEF domain-containing protein [Periweissella beninensis]
MINIYNYSITLFSVLSMLVAYLYVRQFYMFQKSTKIYHVGDLIIYIFLTYVILGLSTKMLGNDCLFALTLILPVAYKNIRPAMIGIGLHPFLVLVYIFKNYEIDFYTLLLVILSEFVIGMVMWVVTNYSHSIVLTAVIVASLLSGLHIFIDWNVNGLVVISVSKTLILLIMNFIFIIVLDKLNNKFNYSRGKILDKLHESEVDGLTGLYNFRQLRADFLQYSQDKRKLTLILIDIDHFKEINDHFGHDQGNQALVLIAENLTATMLDYFTTTDFRIYRYGGEELAIVIFKEYPVVKAILGALKAQLAQASRRDLPCTLTFSAGVSFNANFAGDNQQTFNQADKLLYRIKNQSRNSYLIDILTDEDK